MKKIILLFLASLLLISCEIENKIVLEDDVQEDVPCDFQGRTYTLTSYLYEIPVDLDNDQVYSNEIIDQTNCLVSVMPFDDSDRACDMLSQFASARIIDNNGNLTQGSGCINSDGAGLTCFKNGDEIKLTFSGNTVYSGTISDNGNVLTFVVPDATLRGYHWGSHNILNEDGTVTNYDGNVTLQYELD